VETGLYTTLCEHPSLPPEAVGMLSEEVSNVVRKTNNNKITGKRILTKLKTANI